MSRIWSVEVHRVLRGVCIIPWYCGGSIIRMAPWWFAAVRVIRMPHEVSAFSWFIGLWQAIILNGIFRVIPTVLRYSHASRHESHHKATSRASSD